MLANCCVWNYAPWKYSLRINIYFATRQRDWLVCQRGFYFWALWFLQHSLPIYKVSQLVKALFRTSGKRPSLLSRREWQNQLNLVISDPSPPVQFSRDPSYCIVCHSIMYISFVAACHTAHTLRSGRGNRYDIIVYVLVLSNNIRFCQNLAKLLRKINRYSFTSHRVQ